ncbi:MAG TPA: nitrite/sulfite reductase [Polyangia bacterium]|nr:nitrite/sulfite reductase [Polyangia bacterium]
MDDAPVPAVPDPLRFSSPADIDDFVDHLRRFESGELSSDQFRAYRLTRGTYGQRQQDVNMLRVKIPQGVLSAPQLERIADIADEYSRGFGHVTTRQNVQLHFVKLSRVPEAMTKLDEVGLTTREACGGTVRNVTACALAGVCNGSAFDVTPYGQAVTRHFLRNPICQSMPRKFKIALSGCGDDCAQGAINDVAVLARVRNSERGFEIRVGGGLSTSPEDAHPLESFVPADRLLPVLEAVVRVFDRTGNRQNKSRARLKYVIRKLGLDGFRKEYEAELAKIDADGRGRIAIDVSNEVRPDAVLRLRAPVRQTAAEDGFERFYATNCIKQRQAGYYAVIARLDRGDITSAQLRGAAKLARQFSDGTVRLSNEQNLVYRFVPEASLTALHAELVTLGLGRAGARTIHDVTSCPGADTCNLAVTRSRELTTAVENALSAATGESAEAVKAAEALDIKISGCPNSCGQHHVAALGFHGTMRRVGGVAVPEYQLHLGGGIAREGATFGRQIVKLAARRVPDAVLRLLELYRKERNEGEAPLQYFRRVEPEVVKRAVADLAEFDAATAKPEDWLDHGDEKPFKVAIGQGECAV